MSRRRWVKGSVSVVVVAVGLLWGGPEPGRAQGGAPCAQPYAAVWAEHWTRGPAGRREQLWPKEPVRFPSFGAEPIAGGLGDYDTDGDGEADHDLTVAGSTDLRFPRPGGPLLLSLAKGTTARVRNAGDLDGDGRDEVIVDTDGAPVLAPRTYLVPGSTPGGRLAIADASVDVRASGVLAVGDQDGDGSDDLLVGDSSAARSFVMSGPDALAPGAGGRLTPARPIGPELPGRPGGAWRVDGGGPLMYASVVVGGPRSTITSVRGGTTSTWVTPPTVEDTFEGVVLFRIDGRRFFVMGNGDSYTATNVLWDLDDPCRSFPPRDATGSTEPDAEPAGAVPGTPRFTG